MAQLSGKSRSAINEHILNIYSEGELIENASMKKIGNSDFSKKPTNYYNLDVIISVGYRIRRRQGMQFLVRYNAYDIALDKPEDRIADTYTDGISEISARK